MKVKRINVSGIDVCLGEICEVKEKLDSFMGYKELYYTLVDKSGHYRAFNFVIVGCPCDVKNCMKHRIK